MTIESVINRFNRGEISPDALGRDDLDKIVDSCALMDNLLPVKLGPMVYRPGFEYIGDARSPSLSINRALIPLTRSTGDSVMLEFADTTLRPLSGGLPIAASPDTTTGWVNGGITSGTGWTFTGTAAYNNSALQITEGDSAYQVSPVITAGQKQTFQISIDWPNSSPVLVQVGNGTSPGASDLIERFLMPGDHWLQFTPTSTQFVITFVNRAGELWADHGDVLYARVLTCQNTNSGNLEFTTPSMDYRTVSYDTSADVMFMALGPTEHPRVFKRDREDSFSYERYINLDGPFMPVNTSGIELRAVNTAVGVWGVNVNGLSPLIFDAGDAYRLVKTSNPLFLAENRGSSTFNTNPVPVRGYGEERDLLLEYWAGTVTGALTIELQVCDTYAGTYSTVKTWARTYSSYSVGHSETYNDSEEGVLKFYRLAVTTNTTGVTVELKLTCVSLALYGCVRIHPSGKSAAVTGYSQRDPMIPAGVYSTYWSLGAWRSGTQPQGVALHEGRLVWVSKNRVDMTKTDDYYSFDTNRTEPDYAISRTLGFGPADSISWVAGNNGLFIGLPTTEVMIRSNNYDDALTPLNTNLKPIRGSVGAKAGRPSVSDGVIYFVSRDGVRIHGLVYDAGTKPSITDEMLYHPTACADGVASMTTSKHPESRIWVVTEAGELKVLLREVAEDVRAWSRCTLGGGALVEDVCVLPAQGEDEVWAIVRRGGNSRIEKLSSFTANDNLDSFKRYTSPGSTTLTGLSHLEGLSVGVWADGQNRGDFTVASGQIVVPAVYTNAIVGLRYVGQYQSNKLTQYSATPVLGKVQTVANTAILLRNYAPGALMIGRDFSNLVDLPGALSGAIVTEDHTQFFGFNGASEPDPRICIQVTGPARILALSYQMNIRSQQNGG